MSASEAERFASDLKTKTALLDELKKSAGGLGLSGIVTFAASKGYSFNADEAKEYIEKKAHKELTDQQLDRIAGGKGGGGSATVSSTVAATTYSVAATVTDVGQAVGGVTVAVVAAVIVIT